MQTESWDSVREHDELANVVTQRLTRLEGIEPVQ
jgi:hypothetical protein